MHDIRSKKDITILVDNFYNKVRKDDLIGPIFSNRIGANSWKKHLSKMYSFWNTVLFGQADYRGNPFSHHINLNLSTEHFDRWISLFEESINNLFEGPKANETLERAHKMRKMFETKLNYIHSNPNVKSIM